MALSEASESKKRMIVAMWMCGLNHVCGCDTLSERDVWIKVLIDNNFVMDN